MSISFGKKQIDSGVSAVSTMRKLEDVEFALVEKKVELELIQEDLKTQRDFATQFSGQSDVRIQTADAISKLNKQLKEVSGDIAELEGEAGSLYAELTQNTTGLATIDYLTTEGVERASASSAFGAAQEALNGSAAELTTINESISILKAYAAEHAQDRQVRRQVAGQVSTLNAAKKAAEDAYAQNLENLVSAYADLYITYVSSDTPMGELLTVAGDALDAAVRQADYEDGALRMLRGYIDDLSHAYGFGTQEDIEFAAKGIEHNARKFDFHRKKRVEQEQAFDALMNLVEAAQS